MTTELGDVFIQSKYSSTKMHSEYYVVCKVNVRSIRLAPIVSPTNKTITGNDFNVKMYIVPVSRWGTVTIFYTIHAGKRLEFLSYVGWGDDELELEIDLEYMYESADKEKINNKLVDCNKEINKVIKNTDLEGTLQHDGEVEYNDYYDDGWFILEGNIFSKNKVTYQQYRFFVNKVQSIVYKYFK